MFVLFDSGILLGILCHAIIAAPLILSVPMILETMARGDLAFRIHLQVSNLHWLLCTECNTVFTIFCLLAKVFGRIV